MCRRRGKNENEEKRELIFKEDGQEYAQVLRMLGNGRLEAQCIDGIKRLCHIRGKMRKKVWVNQGDIILVGLRDYQDAKGDVILKYMADEARSLKQYGELPENIRVNDTDAMMEGEENENAEYVAGPWAVCWCSSLSPVLSSDQESCLVTIAASLITTLHPKVFLGTAAAFAAQLYRPPAAQHIARVAQTGRQSHNTSPVLHRPPVAHRLRSTGRQSHHTMPARLCDTHKRACLLTCPLLRSVPLLQVLRLRRHCRDLAPASVLLTVH